MKDATETAEKILWVTTNFLCSVMFASVQQLHNITLHSDAQSKNFQNHKKNHKKKNL